MKQKKFFLLFIFLLLIMIPCVVNAAPVTPYPCLYCSATFDSWNLMICHCSSEHSSQLDNTLNFGIMKTGLVSPNDGFLGELKTQLLIWLRSETRPIIYISQNGTLLSSRELTISELFGLKVRELVMAKYDYSSPFEWCNGYNGLIPDFLDESECHPDTSTGKKLRPVVTSLITDYPFISGFGYISSSNAFIFFDTRNFSHAYNLKDNYKQIGFLDSEHAQCSQFPIYLVYLNDIVNYGLDECLNNNLYKRYLSDNTYYRAALRSKTGSDSSYFHFADCDYTFGLFKIYASYQAVIDSTGDVQKTSDFINGTFVDVVVNPFIVTQVTPEITTELYLELIQKGLTEEELTRALNEAIQRLIDALLSNPPDPTDPSDPTQPTDPSDPTQPTDPSDPTQPTDPSDPTQPSDPSDPTDPSLPVDPTDPSLPSDPTDPGFFISLKKYLDLFTGLIKFVLTSFITIFDLFLSLSSKFIELCGNFTQVFSFIFQSFPPEFLAIFTLGFCTTLLRGFFHK